MNGCCLDLDAGKFRRAGIEFPGPGPGDTKFVFGLASGDLGVGFGVHIRVQANTDLRRGTHAIGHFGQGLQFGF